MSPSQHQQVDPNTDMGDTDYDTVAFPAQASDLSPAAMATLDQMAADLDDDKPVELNLQVQLKTTDIDSRSGARELTQLRADAVRSYLEEKGVDISEVIFQDEAMTQPVGGEDSDQSMQRVFITILEDSSAAGLSARLGL